VVKTDDIRKMVNQGQFRDGISKNKTDEKWARDTRTLE
jgi:hypothetical protein